MVRSLVLGFGAATMVAAAGSMTPAGQVILGVKHAAAAPAAAAVVMRDKPAAKRVVAAKPSPRARPQTRRAAAARPARAALAPSGQALNVAQFLPLLLQTQSFPSLQSQPTSAASPLAGILGGGASPLGTMLSGGSSLPGLLQQATGPAQPAEPASAPQSAQAPAQVAPAQSPSAQAIREE